MINKTVSELREMAKSSGIANYSKVKNDELIEALNQTEIRKDDKVNEKEPLKEEPEDAVGILEVLADGF